MKKINERNCSIDSKVIKEGGGGSVPCPRAEISTVAYREDYSGAGTALQLVKRTIVEQVSLQPADNHTRIDIHTEGGRYLDHSQKHLRLLALKLSPAEPH